MDLQHLISNQLIAGPQRITYPCSGGILSLSLGRTLASPFHFPNRAIILATGLSFASGFLCLLRHSVPMVGVGVGLFGVLVDLEVHFRPV